MARTRFEWDEEKDALNQLKHGVSFAVAQEAFFDPNRVIARDVKLPEPEIGDRFIIPASGAYTTSYASAFNGFPMPKTVII